MGTSDQTSDLWGRARTRDGPRLSRQGISGSQENCGHLAVCVCRICPLDRERRKGALGRVHGCSYSSRPLHTLYSSPTCFPSAGSQIRFHARTHSLTHTVSLPGASRDSPLAHPNLPAAGSTASSHHPHSTWA